jgi:hypothetical protein
VKQQEIPTTTIRRKTPLLLIAATEAATVQKSTIRRRNAEQQETPTYYYIMITRSYLCFQHKYPYYYEKREVTLSTILLLLEVAFVFGRNAPN